MIADPEPAFSFMALVKEVRAPIKSSRSKTVDPLTLAKQKILKALMEQERLIIDYAMKNEPLPKKGEKTVSAWFSRQSDGWCSSIRYGQASLQIGPKETDTDMLIGDLPAVLNFYRAVRVAIDKGEMDSVIAKAQRKKSDLLKGKTGGQART